MDSMIAIITSSAFATIITTLLNRYFTNKDKKSLEREALKVLLGFELRNQCEKMLVKGTTDLEEYKQLQELNETYKTLGGNGYVKALIQKVDKLPIEE